jgi:hypothetical protein
MASTIRVDIEGNSSGLRNELKKSESSVMDFGSSLRSMAGTLGIAFGVGAVLNFTKSTMSAADAVVDYAKGLGETVKNVVALTRAANETGAGDKMLNWLQRVSAAQAGLAKSGGKGDLWEGLKRINIDPMKWMDKSPGAAFDELTAAAAKSGNAVGILNEVLGSSAAVVAMEVGGIIQAAGGLDKYAESADKATESTRKLADKWESLQKSGAWLKEKGGILLSAGIDTITGARAYQEATLAKEYYVDKRGNEGEGFWAYRNRRKQEINNPASPPPAMDPNSVTFAAQQAQAEAAKKKALLKGFENDKAMKAAAAGYESDDVETLKTKQVALRYSIEKDAGFLTSENLAKQIALEKIITAEIEKRTKAEATAEKRRADILASSAERRIDIASQRRKAMEGITVDVMTPNSLQRIGGFLGGRGGYEFSVAERQQKIMEVQTDYLKSIDNEARETKRLLAQG